MALGEAQMGMGHYRASLLAYRQGHARLHSMAQSLIYVVRHWSRTHMPCRKALDLSPGDQEILAAMSVAQSVLQQTQQQKYSSPDSAIRTTP